MFVSRDQAHYHGGDECKDDVEETCHKAPKTICSFHVRKGITIGEYLNNFMKLLADLLMDGGDRVMTLLNSLAKHFEYF